MNLSFLNVLALSGGDWVIYGLFLCSVVSIAVMIEKGKVLVREMRLFRGMREELLREIGSGDGKAVEKTLKSHEGAAARILQAGLAQAELGPLGMEDAMASASMEESLLLEKRLLVLGTLGSNAPFIGLFGTVLGVIKAFKDLAQTSAGPEVVMQGLSEALIATAVGLFVAIPCVVGFNYYQKKVKDLLSGTEALGRLLRTRQRAGAKAGAK